MSAKAMSVAGDSVRKSITVEAPREVAFRVFTAEMTSWWPLESHHIGAVAAKDAVLEPFAGGRWFERGADGSECMWGRVLAWEPPHRVLLGWEINAQWKHDPSVQTEVEVRFIAETPERTRVELEHRHLDRFGEKREAMQAAFDSEGGWTGLLQRFAQAATRAWR